MRKDSLVPVMLAAVLLAGCGSGSGKPAETEYIPMTLPPETEPPTLGTTEVADTATPITSFAYAVQEDGTVTITDFIGSETDVEITSAVGDAPVTALGQYAFEAAWDVQRVKLPESVQFIGEEAFLDCESLTEVNIPEGVTVLYRGTFAGCTSLTELTIPESVTETYEELLSGCPLERLTVLNPALTYVSWGLEDLEGSCTICAPEGAAILAWAEEHGFPTEIL